MKKKRIFLDAGHNYSGWNTGAIGHNMREQDISYEVCKMLSEILKEDFDIKLSRPTRETNLGVDNSSSINARWEEANKWYADYFISVHCNAFNGNAQGAETLYFKEDSRDFAKIIQEVYVLEMGVSDRGIKFRNDVGVLRNTKMPSVLVELGFIDNIKDAVMLSTERPKMAKGIANGIYKLLNICKKDSEEKNGEDNRTEEMYVKRFNKVEEMPSWSQATIEKLVEFGVLNGNENGLNLSEDMLRIFVIHDRAGLYRDLSTKNIALEEVARFTSEEVEMIEKIVHAEARGEDEKGQILVTNVILNRLDDKRYPNTIEEVIFQPNQFEPTRNGMFEIAQPGESTKNAVKQAIAGQDYSQGALFFRSTNTIVGSWHQENLQYLFTHGGHAFFK